MQNEPKQVVYARPLATPKLKNDWLTIVLKILLFGGLFFSNFFTGKRNFNMLFMYIIDPSDGASWLKITGSTAAEFFATMGGDTLAASMKIVAPLILSAIVFLVYLLYAKFFAYLVFNQFRVLQVDFNIRKFRICLDTSIILLTVLMGISRVIFSFYPIASNLGMALVDVVFAIIALTLFFFTFSKGLEKKYRPILLNIMLVPAICLVLFV